jgi:hypothetical protein
MPGQWVSGQVRTGKSEIFIFENAQRAHSLSRLWAGLPDSSIFYLSNPLGHLGPPGKAPNGGKGFSQN